MKLDRAADVRSERVEYRSIELEHNRRGQCMCQYRDAWTTEAPTHRRRRFHQSESGRKILLRHISGIAHSELCMFHRSGFGRRTNQAHQRFCDRKSRETRQICRHRRYLLPSRNRSPQHDSRRCSPSRTLRVRSALADISFFEHRIRLHVTRINKKLFVAFQLPKFASVSSVGDLCCQGRSDV